MKKTKLLTTLSTLGIVGAIVPIVASCSSTLASLSDEDKTFLDSINAVIEPLDFEGVPFKAVHAVKNAGINLFEHKFSNSNFQLVLNMDDAKEYAVLYNDVLLTSEKRITKFNKNKVWKFVDKYDSTSEYAQHLNDNFKWNSEETLEVTGSLDTGTNTNVKNIKYIGTTTQKTTYLRTYTNFLTIEPQAADAIHHFHYANNVLINGGNSSSHYLEYGRVGYLQAASAKLSFTLTKAFDEPNSIDVFEPKNTSVEIIAKAEKSTIHYQAGHIKTKGVSLGVPEVDIKSIETFEQLIGVNTACVARIAKDINITDTQTSTWTIGTVDTELDVVLDLNGHSIISPNNSTIAELIHVNHGALTLIDSAGPSSVGAIKGSRSIKVQSANTSVKAKMLMDGGRIEFNLNLNTQRAALIVNGTDAWAEFYMYGGSIKANKMIQSDAAATCAVKSFGLNSYSYYVYGDVYGTNGAIVTEDEGVLTKDTQIEIFGGDFACDNNNICINLRKESKLMIYGGSFTGGTCIGVVNSIVTLNGGVFKAHGEVVDDFYDTGTKQIISDGSVIACYWNNDTDHQPNIISNNVKMYSDLGNILHIGQNNTTTPTVPSWMEFISGCYYFNGKAHKTGCMAGMSYDTATYAKFQWLQKGLWNNIPK